MSHIQVWKIFAFGKLFLYYSIIISTDDAFLYLCRLKRRRIFVSTPAVVRALNKVFRNATKNVSVHCVVLKYNKMWFKTRMGLKKSRMPYVLQVVVHHTSIKSADAWKVHGHPDKPTRSLIETNVQVDLCTSIVSN